MRRARDGPPSPAPTYWIDSVFFVLARVGCELGKDRNPKIDVALTLLRSVEIPRDVRCS